MRFHKFSALQLKVFLIFYAVYLTSPALADQVIETQADRSKTSGDQVMGVGALGRIEPRNRVIRVSHNAGAEGANLQQLFFQEGDLVKSDDVLALLADHNKRLADIDVAKANVKVLEAKLAVERITHAYNQKEYARYQSLVKTATTSVSMADQKHLTFQQSQATITQLQAEIAGAKADQQVAEENLAKTVIKAPIAGTIVKIQTWPGERISDLGLLEMADLTQLDIVAEVYEVDLPKVHVGQTAEIRLVGYTEPYRAKVRELGFQIRKNDLNDTDPLADKDNRIIEVRLTLEDKAVMALQHQIYRQVQVRILP
jgi:HlyD family secretion protein